MKTPRSRLLRKMIGVTGAVALVAVGAGCAQQSEGQTGGDTSIVLYAADPIVDQVVKEFNKEHPEIKVDVVTGTSGEMLARAQAEAGDARGDVLWIGGNYADDGTVFADYESDVLNDVYPQFRDAAKPGAPVNSFVTAYMYNTKVAPEADMPKHWADLADPKWKGKVQIANPATSGSAFRVLVNWVEVGGWDLVAQIMPNLVVTESSLDPLKATAQGEAAIGLNVESGVFQYMEGPDTKAGYVEDPVIQGFNSIYLLKKKDEVKPAAKTFVDFMIGEQNQRWMVENIPGTRPINTKVTDLPEGMPALDQLQLIAFPEEAVTNKEDYLSKWRDLVTSQ